LKLRREGPEEKESLFIPHHPHAMAKRTSFEHDDKTPITAKIGVKSPCVGEPENQVGYHADTLVGSSGAPVISMKDHSLIAIHRCGGCDVAVGMNSAINAKTITQDLERQGKAVKEFFL